MKKAIFTLAVIIIAMMNSNLQAQEVKRPLDPKEKTEAIPMSLEEGQSWVKAHWEWNGTKYEWTKGAYVETRQGYVWMDGEWERNQKSGWWLYNSGYWQKEGVSASVNNDRNTLEADKQSKEARQQNKMAGLYIKTGSAD